MYVYRFIDENEDVLYVGKTKNIASRIKAHEKNGTFEKINYSIEYIYIENNVIGDMMEIYLINKYKPKYNSDSKYEDCYSNTEFENYCKIWNLFCNGKDINKNENYDYSIFEDSNLRSRILKEFIIISGDKYYEYNQKNSVNFLTTNWIKEEENIKKIKNMIVNRMSNRYLKYNISSGIKNKIWTSQFNIKFVVEKSILYILKKWVSLENTEVIKNVELVCFLANVFMNKKNANFKESKDYALYTMLKFLSNIEGLKEKPIALYIPSSRMREMLEDWLNQ